MTLSFKVIVFSIPSLLTEVELSFFSQFLFYKMGQHNLLRGVVWFCFEILCSLVEGLGHAICYIVGCGGMPTRFPTSEQKRRNDPTMPLPNSVFLAVMCASTSDVFGGISWQMKWDGDTLLKILPTLLYGPVAAAFED